MGAIKVSGPALATVKMMEADPGGNVRAWAKALGIERKTIESRLRRLQKRGVVFYERRSKTWNLLKPSWQLEKKSGRGMAQTFGVMRDCMRCGSRFESTGNGHRHCADCRSWLADREREMI